MANLTTEAFNIACRSNFHVFAQRAFRILEPGNNFQDEWFLDCICEHLEASFRGELPWLIINMPPRVLKSAMVAQLYVAWVLGKEPEHQFIGASYAHTLAEKNVVRTRQIMSDAWYQQCFPRTRISQDQNQKDYFTTTLSGQYKGTGIGGTITGFGCKTLLCDDILNPQEGASDVIRTNTNNEMRSTLFSRFNDRATARFIMIMQRIHQDDPTGNLLENGRYHLLKLPAETNNKIFIELGKKTWGMEPGDLLSERLKRKDLDEIRSDLGDANYVAQYLQEPVPIGGGEFKQQWVNYYRLGGVRPKEMNIVILVDPSGGEKVNKKKGKLSDFTAMMVVGLAPDNNYYLLDGIRDRLNPTERVDTLFFLHRKWNSLSGKPPKVGYEKYGMMSDTHYVTTKQNADSYRFQLIELGGQISKEERIRQLIPDMQCGRWWFPDTLMYTDSDGRTLDLIKEIVSSEMATFPRSRYDDMIDDLSRTYDAKLMLSFPTQKRSVSQAQMDDAMSPEDSSWMGF